MKRRCLKCQNSFDSEGPWNRICGNCHLVNSKLGFYVHQIYAGDRHTHPTNGEKCRKQINILNA